MFFIFAETYNDDADGRDEIVIGLFSTVEKCIDAARHWIKEEREGGSEDDICLCGWRSVPDTGKVERLDLAHDEGAKNLTSQFRRLEKEFPVMENDE